MPPTTTTLPTPSPTTVIPPVGAPSAGHTAELPIIEPTDGELLTQFGRFDDTAALATVVDRHTEMVWRVVSRVLRRPADAEDAYQATMLLLARKANRIRANDSAAGWLFRVAYHTALLAKRRRKTRREAPLDDSLPGGEPPAPEVAFPDFERQQTIATLIEELRGMPAKYQTPLVLRYLEGKSRRQIADATDATVATVAGQLVRGKRMLRLRLARRGVSLAAAMAAFTGAAKAGEALGTTKPAAPPPPFDPGLITTGATAAVSTLVTQGARSMLFASMVKPAAVGLAGATVALVLFAEATTAANPGAASQKNATAGSPPGVVLDASVAEEPPADPPAVAFATNKDETSRKRQRPNQQPPNQRRKTTTRIAPTIVTKEGQPATIGVDSNGQTTELTVTPTIQGDTVQIAAEVKQTSKVYDISFDEKAQQEQKFIDALREDLAEQARQEKNVDLSQPSFAELFRMRSYWSAKEFAAAETLKGSQAANKHQPGVVPAKEISVAVAEVQQAKAKILELERQMKQAALRETGGKQPVPPLPWNQVGPRADLVDPEGRFPGVQPALKPSEPRASDAEVSALRELVDETLALWKKIKKLQDQGAAGGSDEREAEARAAYFAAKTQLERVLAGVNKPSSSTLRSTLQARVQAAEQEVEATQKAFGAGRATLGQLQTALVRRAEAKIDLAKAPKPSVHTPFTPFADKSLQERKVEGAIRHRELTQKRNDAVLADQRQTTDAQNQQLRQEIATLREQLKQLREQRKPAPPAASTVLRQPAPSIGLMGQPQPPNVGDSALSEAVMPAERVVVLDGDRVLLGYDGIVKSVDECLEHIAKYKDSISAVHIQQSDAVLGSQGYITTLRKITTACDELGVEVYEIGGVVSGDSGPQRSGVAPQPVKPPVVVPSLSRPRLSILGPITMGDAPTTLAEPTKIQIRAAMSTRGGHVPYWPGDAWIELEKTGEYVDPPRVYPLVGEAVQHHTHYTCKVYQTRRATEPAEVHYLDHHHLHVVAKEAKADPVPVPTGAATSLLPLQQLPVVDRAALSNQFVQQLENTPPSIPTPDIRDILFAVIDGTVNNSNGPQLIREDAEWLVPRALIACGYKLPVEIAKDIAPLPPEATKNLARLGWPFGDQSQGSRRKHHRFFEAWKLTALTERPREERLAVALHSALHEPKPKDRLYRRSTIDRKLPPQTQQNIGAFVTQPDQSNAKAAKPSDQLRAKQHVILTPDESPVLQYGDNNGAVQRLQRFVLRKHWPPPGWKLTPNADDGNFGPLSKKAVQRLQAKHGLPETGIVDALTWDMLPKDIFGSMPILQQGDQGPLVAQARRLLVMAIDRGIPYVKRNGFDVEVERAVREFQQANGLPETGKIETGTWRLLQQAARSAVEPPPTASDPVPLKPGDKLFVRYRYANMGHTLVEFISEVDAKGNLSFLDDKKPFKAIGLKTDDLAAVIESRYASPEPKPAPENAWAKMFHSVAEQLRPKTDLDIEGVYRLGGGNPLARFGATQPPFADESADPRPLKAGEQVVVRMILDGRDGGLLTGVPILITLQESFPIRDKKAAAGSVFEAQSSKAVGLTIAQLKAVLADRMPRDFATLFRNHSDADQPSPEPQFFVRRARPEEIGQATEDLASAAGLQTGAPRETLKPFPPYAPVAGQPSDAWRVLGLQLEPTELDTPFFKKSRYRGGMRVTGVRRQSPASEAGVRFGDVLVGLHRWETASPHDVAYATNYFARRSNGERVKFYVVRDDQTLFGYLWAKGPNAAQAARHQADQLRLRNAELMAQTKLLQEEIEQLKTQRKKPPVAPPANGKIQPGDRLAIEVYDRWHDRGLSSRQHRVDPGGSVALGAKWGRVEVAGASLAGAEKAITRKIIDEMELAAAIWVRRNKENGHDVKKEPIDIAVQVTRVRSSVRSTKPPTSPKPLR